ncbi:hypothetical protein [Aureispira anguillae]|uniref:Uncharacterized protein n=1 Tax=Aureispira anguillae TaxID=2864201 RepID=A0A915YBX6_9BACT|nr:hypothetical protein [Aureispira anguillae]BDS10259.1 hypothetical protein AsAng_0009670 [Aureispira anguillae]
MFKKSIFELTNKESPLGNWMESQRLKTTQKQQQRLSNDRKNTNLNKAQHLKSIGNKVCSILYTEANNDNSHTEVFKKFGWKLRNEYNGHAWYGKARAGGVSSGLEIVNAVNKKTNLYRLDIIGHGGPKGIFFAWDQAPQHGDNYVMPSLMGRSVEVVATKRNLYATTTHKAQDSTFIKTKDEDGNDIETNSLAVVGTKSASLYDINFSVFSNDAIIEFHGCNTAGHPSYGNWKDTSVWLFKEDNIAYWASILLYQAGKEKAVAIGHYAGSGPEGTLLSNDYRQNRRIVYHNGTVIIDTYKTGDLWLDIFTKML